MGRPTQQGAFPDAMGIGLHSAPSRTASTVPQGRNNVFRSRHSGTNTQRGIETLLASFEAETLARLDHLRPNP